MSATYSNKPRQPREPLSPQEIALRISLAIFGIALFFAIFVLPWMFSAGGR